MKILVRGEKSQTEELLQRLSSVEADITVMEDADLLSANLCDYPVIFDLDFDNNKEDELRNFARAEGLVIVSAVKTSLAKEVHGYGKHMSFSLVGMNCLPGFINRDLAEITVLNPATTKQVNETFSALGFRPKVVDDRVGMVTPRIVCMIINEACYTVQEGTATMQDIDTSMKLGTNYPYGPFEWADRIGLKNVYEVLEAVYNDTHDERYKICPLLKTKYLRGEGFYY
jgi:3-hydroxybutyryl-CoA dehydrogenase